MDLSLVDTNFLFLLIGGMVAIFGLLMAVYGINAGLRNSGRMTRRVETFVAPESLAAVDPKAAPIIPRELQGSLLRRTLGEGFKKFLAAVGRYAPHRMAHNLDHQLTVAGRPGNLTAGGFFALRLLFLLLGLGLAYLFNRDPEIIGFNSLLLGLLAIIVCWLLPVTWLKGRARTRQAEILRGLPDALDMLSVCATAGLGFDQSLQRISQYWDTELGRELLRATYEMEMGLSRTEALRHMSARLDVDDLTRFIATIVQAERIGMSYAAVLHSQAEQMRVLRQLRARELANKLPGKIIIPVALFIFPAMLIVLLGPAIPTIISLFSTF
jgi:tight adherence protein C